MSKLRTFLLVILVGSSCLALVPGSSRHVTSWLGLAGGGAFDPLSISGIEWWIDSSDSSSITLQSGTNLVSQWNDKSGKEKHLTQSTSGNRPIFLENIKNGKSVVRFDGSSDLMSVQSSSTLFNFMHQSNTSWFAVTKIGTNQYPSTGQVLFDNTDFGVGSGHAFAYRPSRAGSTNLYQLFITRGVTDFVILNVPNNSGLAGQYINVAHISDVSASTTNRSKLYINNTLYMESTSTGSPNTGSASYNFTVGRDVTGSSSFYLNGDICEIIIYSGILSSSDTTKIRDYLVAKWGL